MNQSRCWANDSGRGRSRGVRVIGGGAAVRPPRSRRSNSGARRSAESPKAGDPWPAARIKAGAPSPAAPASQTASAATVGSSKSLRTGTSQPRAASRRAATRLASSEWPPTAKKLSWTPTRSIPRTSHQMSAVSASRPGRGATKAAPSLRRLRIRDGSPRRPSDSSRPSASQRPRSPVRQRRAPGAPLRSARAPSAPFRSARAPGAPFRSDRRAPGSAKGSGTNRSAVSRGRPR